MLESEAGKGRILIVEDEAANVRMLRRLLRKHGFEDVESTTDPRDAVSLFRDFRPDLVLLDLHMPHLDGFQVMERLGPEIPDYVYLPILVLTGDGDPAVRKAALAAGARDFVNKPFEVTEVLLRIENLLETRFLHLQLVDQNERLEEKVKERTEELAATQVEILHRLAVAAEYRDDVTGQHAERVGILSSLVAEELGLDDEAVDLIRRAAPLHDVGKIGIPDAILLKPGPLTPQEFEVMKSHTTIGARILSGGRFPLLRMARDIALTHHERWDGRGYTPGMAGEEIPLSGRIVAVADVFDSLIHERPYKEAAAPEEAVDELVRERGRQFDPDVVDAFLRVLESERIPELGHEATSASRRARKALEDTLSSLRRPHVAEVA